jgi:hypothetical protein
LFQWQTDQGNLLEVADPVMIQTGLFDSTGKNEVVLPAIHSVSAHDKKNTQTHHNDGSHHTTPPILFPVRRST